MVVQGRNGPIAMAGALQARLISPLEGEMSGRTEGGAKERDSRRTSGSAILVGLCTTAPPSGLPPISPARGEIS